MSQAQQRGRRVRFRGFVEARASQRPGLARRRSTTLHRATATPSVRGEAAHGRDWGRTDAVLARPGVGSSGPALRPAADGCGLLASLSIANSNRLVGWLRDMEALRGEALRGVAEDAV